VAEATGKSHFAPPGRRDYEFSHRLATDHRCAPARQLSCLRRARRGSIRRRDDSPANCRRSASKTTHQWIDGCLDMTPGLLMKRSDCQDLLIIQHRQTANRTPWPNAVSCSTASAGSLGAMQWPGATVRDYTPTTSCGSLCARQMATPLIFAMFRERRASSAIPARWRRRRLGGWWLGGGWRGGRQWRREMVP